MEGKKAKIWPSKFIGALHLKTLFLLSIFKIEGKTDGGRFLVCFYSPSQSIKAVVERNLLLYMSE